MNPLSVAIDAYSTNLLGRSPQDIEHIRFAYENSSVKALNGLNNIDAL